MIRSNIGNMATNALQTLSVTGTTASGFKKQSDRARLADASSALNNLSEDELREVGKMRADKLKDEVGRYKAGGESPFQHLSNEEAGAYQEKRAEQMRNFISEDSSGGESVDEIMSGLPLEKFKTPETEALKTHMKTVLEFSEFYVRGEGGRFKKGTVEDLIKEKRGKSGDADS